MIFNHLYQTNVKYNLSIISALIIASFWENWISENPGQDPASDMIPWHGPQQDFTIWKYVSVCSLYQLTWSKWEKWSKSQSNPVFAPQLTQHLLDRYELSGDSRCLWQHLNTCCFWNHCVITWNSHFISRLMFFSSAFRVYGYFNSFLIFSMKELLKSFVVKYNTNVYCLHFLGFLSTNN